MKLTKSDRKLLEVVRMYNIKYTPDEEIDRMNAPAVTSEDDKAPERGLPKELPQDNTQGRG